MRQNNKIQISLLVISLCFFFGVSLIHADSIPGTSIFYQIDSTSFTDSLQQQAPQIGSGAVPDTTAAKMEEHKSTAAEKMDSTANKLLENKGGLNLDRLQAPSIDKIITPSKIVWTIIFILLGYLIIGFFAGLLNRFGERSPRYRIAVKRIVPILKMVGWSFVVFVIVQGIIRPPMTTVLAFFTSIGVAVAFAAQDLLKNIFGGLMILFDRPFQIGDKIEAGGSYGEVLKIGLRATRIVTADDSVVSVPNAEMMNNAISNSNSGENNCQVVAEIYLPIDVDTQKARKIAMEAAVVSKYIFLNKPVAVVFVNEMHQRKSLLKMRLKAYVSDVRFEFAFKSDMTEITIKELIKQGIINPDTF